MRKAISLVFCISLWLAFACSTEKPVKLEKGTDIYGFAKEISQKIPFLDPDSNNVIVSTDFFQITTGEALDRLDKNFGHDITPLKSISLETLKKNIRDTAERMAVDRLLLRKAKEAGISVRKADIDSVMELQYERSGGRDNYIDFIKNNGLDLKYVKNEIRKNIRIQRYIDRALAGKITVSEAEIEDVYQQDKTATVRHILKSTVGKSEAEKKALRKEIESLLRRARKGEDFATLAKKYSDDPGTKESGGLLTDLPRGRTVPAFERVAFSLPIGEISDVIETEFGFHIIKVLERKKETRPLSEVRDEIRRQLAEEKRQKAYKELVERLKREAGYTVVEF